MRMRTPFASFSGKASGALLMGMLLSLLSLSSCALPLGGAPQTQTLTIAVIAPISGANGAIGRSMAQAVELAVAQHHALGSGYALTAMPVDESSVTVATDVSRLATTTTVVGVVGPFDSATAVTALPALSAASLATISPTATLPGLTQASQAAAEGLDFRKLHPTGKPTAFFRMAADDNALGAATAALALAPPDANGANGLGAHSMFLVNDGSLSAIAQTTAFQHALLAGNGVVAGHSTLSAEDPLDVQRVVAAIIEAHPDGVFYAGGIALGAALRGTLTLTGAPSLPMITAGAIADDPTWSGAVGKAAAAANTTALLPGAALSQMSGAAAFMQAYKSAYPNGVAPTSQSALAYDAAMDEISAITELIAAHASITRSAVLAKVATRAVNGVSGHVAFTAAGDPASAPALSVFMTDATGDWKLVGTRSNNAA